MEMNSFQLPNSNFGQMLGAGTSNPLGGGSFEQYPFDLLPSEESGAEQGEMKVVRCVLSAGSTELRCDDTDVTVPQSGKFYIWARIDHSQIRDNRMQVLSGNAVPSSTVRYTVKTLYELEDGQVKNDLRVPLVLVIAS